MSKKETTIGQVKDIAILGAIILVAYVAYNIIHGIGDVFGGIGDLFGGVAKGLGDVGQATAEMFTGSGGTTYYAQEQATKLAAQWQETLIETGVPEERAEQYAETVEPLVAKTLTPSVNQLADAVALIEELKREYEETEAIEESHELVETVAESLGISTQEVAQPTSIAQLEQVSEAVIVAEVQQVEAQLTVVEETPTMTVTVGSDGTFTGIMTILDIELAKELAQEQGWEHGGSR